MSAYTLGDVARICGVSRRRLRYWERTALVRASLEHETAPGSADSQPVFGFRELASVRTIIRLLDRGVPLRRIRRSVEAVRARLPELEPLSALGVWEGSERVVVLHQGVLMEPDGQLVLEFGRRLAPVEDLVLPAAIEVIDTARAGEWFERGCELDTDSSTYDEAVEAYRDAIGADPGFVDAHCNLGSVYFNQNRRAQARDSFERALALDPDHVESNLNLGAMLEDEGRDEQALRHYRTALATDPLFPDGHVSLALIYDKLGLPRTARRHWRSVLQLDPTGPWSDAARRRLSDH